MTSYLDEAQVEIVTVDYFRELGYEYVHGPQIAPDGETPLLPRFLSGEIEVPVAKAIAEEVARWPA